ncbi:unnamed protein product [Amoebophrya sp. A25]|nr:unnamed protein product [Amoebophrya sp. A25]|eukprot:GSA25T00009876001.1
MGKIMSESDVPPGGTTSTTLLADEADYVDLGAKSKPTSGCDSADVPEGALDSGGKSSKHSSSPGSARSPRAAANQGVEEDSGQNGDATLPADEDDDETNEDDEQDAPTIGMSNLMFDEEERKQQDYFRRWESGKPHPYWTDTVQFVIPLSEDGSWAWSFSIPGLNGYVMNFLYSCAVLFYMYYTDDMFYGTMAMLASLSIFPHLEPEPSDAERKKAWDAFYKEEAFRKAEEEAEQRYQAANAAEAEASASPDSGVAKFPAEAPKEDGGSARNRAKPIGVEPADLD